MQPQAYLTKPQFLPCWNAISLLPTSWQHVCMCLQYKSAVSSKEDIQARRVDVGTERRLTKTLFTMESCVRFPVH